MFGGPFGRELRVLTGGNMRILLLVAVIVMPVYAYSLDNIAERINMELDSGKDIRILIIDKEERTDLQMELIKRFRKYPNFSIISRAVLEIQIEEMSLSLNDLSDSVRQIEVGKILTATHLIVVYRNGGMNLIDVSTSIVLASEKTMKYDNIIDPITIGIAGGIIYASHSWYEIGAYDSELWEQQYWGFKAGFDIGKKINRNIAVGVYFDVGYMNDWLIQHTLQESTEYITFATSINASYYLNNYMGLRFDIGYTSETKTYNKIYYAMGINLGEYSLLIAPVSNGVSAVFIYKIIF